MQVERYNESQVKTAPLATPQASGLPATAFGAGLGVGLSNAGNSGLDIAAGMQHVKNQTDTYNGKIMIDNIAQANAYGDDDNEGFLTLRGDDAEKFRKDYLSDFKDKAMASIPADANDLVKNALYQIVQERATQLSGEYGRHTASQIFAANDAANQAMLDSSLRNVGNYFNDPTRVESEIAVMRHVVEEGVKQNYGEGEEATQILKDRLSNATSKAYGTVLDRMMIDNASAAQVYYQQHKDDMTSEDQYRYEHAIKPLADSQKGIDLAYSMIPRLKNGERLDDLLVEGQKQFSSNTGAFKMFQGEMKTLAVDIHEAGTLEAQRLALPVQQLIIQAEAGGGKMDPATLAQSDEYKSLVAAGTPEATTLASQLLDKTYTEHHAVLVEQRAESREARSEARFTRMEGKQDKAAQKEALRETQLSAWTDLSLNPDKVASMSDYELNQNVLSLGQVYGNKLLAMRKEMTSPEKLAQAKVDSKTFNSLMDQVGITNKGDRSKYYAAAQDYIVAQQKENGRVFTPDQMRQALVGAFQDVQVNQRTSPLGIDALSWTGSSTKKLIDVGNPEAVVIPADDQAKIANFLTSNNVSDTQQNRLRVYRRLLANRGIAKSKGIQ
jgi:hypothetical protein